MTIAVAVAVAIAIASVDHQPSKPRGNVAEGMKMSDPGWGSRADVLRIASTIE